MCPCCNISRKRWAGSPRGGWRPWPTQRSFPLPPALFPFFFISNLPFAALVRQQEALGFLSRAFNWRDVLTALITVAGKERKHTHPPEGMTLPLTLRALPVWPPFSLGASQALSGLHDGGHSSVQANFTRVKIWIGRVPSPCPPLWQCFLELCGKDCCQTVFC